MSTTTQQFDVEAAVLDRYKQGAREVEPRLCCASTNYDKQYLQVIPQEIINKDYGCGDPTVHVGSGETVVDLGCGAGKICYILAQKVGANGRVIGVDFNDEMLDLARRYQPQISSELGYDNVHFVKGRIQDLALSLGKVQAYLDERPIQSTEDLIAFDAECERLRAQEPLIKDGTVDVVVSNCVLNLVKSLQKTQLFSEIFRVLKRDGRAVISDIVSDEDPTESMLNDPDLWSGCIAGAFREDSFLDMFAQAGFYGIEILTRQEEPWQVIDGIEFRSMTVRAYKGKEGPCLERNQAVIYNGPWEKVIDDDGHTLNRGQRMAVCDKTYRIYTNPDGPYAADITAMSPLEPIPLDEAKPFACSASALRHPRQIKGLDYKETRVAEGDCCGPDGCC